MVMTQHRPFIRALRAQWLGQRLRDLREQRGMSLELVAEHLNRDRSALGRYERAELLNLADEVWRTDRWTDNYGDLVDASFIDFPWLESRANTVCSYHAMVIPGLAEWDAFVAGVRDGEFDFNTSA